jgi:DNA-binding MarR family transcriptional regulator
MAVSSLCIGSAVPATTALRWIKSLEGKGLIVRTPDPYDGRRIFISLSDKALQQMDTLFTAIPAEEHFL